MSQNPHEIFTTPEDHWSWDKYIEQCDRIDLSDEDRQRVKDELQYLRELLGEGFLRRAMHQENPLLFWYFENAAPRARIALLRFAGMFRTLGRAQNFRAVLNRIRKPEDTEELAEGLSVFEAAYKFHQAGLTVDFTIPVIASDHHGNKRRTVPDIRLTDEATGQELFVEVSRLKPSDAQNLISRTHRVLFHLLDDIIWRYREDITSPRYILPYAKFYLGLNDQELTDVIKQIQELTNEVRNSGEFRELIIKDTIEVAIAPPDEHDRVREWAYAREMQDLVEGPSIPLDEIRRAKRKLFEKAYQLPDDRPGIIVIETTGNLLFFTYDVRGIVVEIAQEVRKYPRLLYAILHHAFDDPGQDEPLTLQIGPHTFARTVRSDGVIAQAVIVRNDACNPSLEASTIEKLRQAFSVS